MGRWFLKGRIGKDSEPLQDPKSLRDATRACSIPICLIGAFTLIACGEPATRAAPQTPTAVAAKRISNELTTVELARGALPSVVAIQTPDGKGSGFFLTPDLVVTCFHVVRGNSEIRLKAVGWSGIGSSVVSWREDNDLAVVRVTPPAPGRGLHIDPGPYVVGTKIVAVSAPLGLEDTVSEGIVSALRSDPEDRIQFTAPISPGSSGGPILNVRGEVAGMVASFRATVDRGVTIGQNLNFAVPASFIAAALRKPNEASLESFAATTIPNEEKKWREIEAGLNTLDSELGAILGERVGRHFARAVRKAVADRDNDGTKRLIDRTVELEKYRKSLTSRVEALQLLGGQGRQLSGALVSAWEDWAIDPNDETEGRLSAEVKRGVAFSTEVEQRLQRPTLPDRFAGFPFMGSVAAISTYCLGYELEAPAGLSTLQCPRVPLTPPFASGGAGLTFLNGVLVGAEMAVPSYQDAVRAIAAKYGEPVPAVYVHDNWSVTNTPSYGPGTSFNWSLNGGRIRVGRLQGKPFVTFIRDERDQAILSSY